MNDMHREAFREEAREMLVELEAALLELEASPEDMELVGRAFRALHTLKGSGSMFGFDDVAALVHDIETSYDRVRQGRMTVTRQLVDLTLTASDLLHVMIDEPENVEERRPEVEATIAAFHDLVQAPAALPVPGATSVPEPAPPPEGMATWRIGFQPGPHLFACGTNPLLLLEELRGLGTSRFRVRTCGIPPLAEMDPERCYTGWDLIVTTDRGEDAVRDVFLFVEDDSEITLERVPFHPDEEDQPRLGEILVDRGSVAPEAVRDALQAQKKPLGALLVEAGIVDSDQVQAALQEQAHLREVLGPREPRAASSSVRVPAEKLDALVNLVGELVTVRSRLEQLALQLGDSSLTLINEELERLIAELRDNTMSIRMLPIGTTFQKFTRLVRDLSRELGKEVDLETSGGDTGLDKTVIERLNDPLVHILRNSVDHGIESPEVRQAKGKPRRGKVSVSARHEGAQVVIEIQDDGGGINRAAVRRRAVEAGLMAEDAHPPDSDLFGYIFAPGFSTSKEITSVSGRGVGMDVVKRAIDGVQGSIEVSSVEGEGTTILLRLPLTLAIIDGLLVRLDRSYFVLPLACTEECVELTAEDAQRNRGDMAMIRGELVPYLPLRRCFGFSASPPPIQQIVVTRLDGRRVGFVVDQVVGQHQTVIKSLGTRFGHAEEFSGATILGDGTVALILDAAGLVRKAERTVGVA